MAVPKKKVSKSRRGQRRSHNALGKTTVVEDKTSGELKRPHHVSSDGYYKGRQITTQKVKR
jgi:large subunit ribosomal protein L32